MRSFVRIRIRICDPRSYRSRCIKGTELQFIRSVTMTAGAKLQSASAESRAKFKNENKMAVAHGAAVVLSIEELSDNSILQETRSCEDEEFLQFLLIRERQSDVRIENYFERTKPLYIVSDFLRANVSMNQTNSGKSPKFVFPPTFIFCIPICSNNCGVVFL